MSNNQTCEKRTACCTEREGKTTAERDCNCSQSHTKSHCDAECNHAHGVELSECRRITLRLSASLYAVQLLSQLSNSLLHVELEDSGEELNEQNNADNAEYVSNAVTCRYHLVQAHRWVNI